MAVAALVALGTLRTHMVLTVRMTAGAEVVAGLCEGTRTGPAVSGALTRRVSVVSGRTTLTVGSHRVVKTFLQINTTALNQIFATVTYIWGT